MEFIFGIVVLMLDIWAIVSIFGSAPRPAPRCSGSC